MLRNMSYTELRLIKKYVLDMCNCIKSWFEPAGSKGCGALLAWPHHLVTRPSLSHGQNRSPLQHSCPVWYRCWDIDTCAFPDLSPMKLNNSMRSVLTGKRYKGRAGSITIHYVDSLPRPNAEGQDQPIGIPLSHDLSLPSSTLFNSPNDPVLLQMRHPPFYPCLMRSYECFC
jgi:hypothetical protein